MDAQSIAAIPEHDLVPFLLGHGMLRGMILAAAGATMADRFLFRVPVEAMAPKGGETGDIDALVTRAAHQVSRRKLPFRVDS